jgi:hypothetical protein
MTHWISIPTSVGFLFEWWLAWIRGKLLIESWVSRIAGGNGCFYTRACRRSERGNPEISENERGPARLHLAGAAVSSSALTSGRHIQRARDSEDSYRSPFWFLPSR